MKQSFKVVITPSAKNDVIQARKWYKQINAELPKRFREGVSNVLVNLKIRPHVHAIRYRYVRIAAMPVFPYSIHYFIDEEAGRVVVIGVHHTSIDPSKWRHPL